MRVLVTRPLDDARETAAKLATLGHEAIVAPLFEVRFRDGSELSTENVQAVLITSANGIRSLAGRTKRRDIPVLAVGTHSASLARGLGFTSVESTDGDANALSALVAGKLSPKSGVLLHAGGAHTANDFVDLERCGFSVRREFLYEAASSKIAPAILVDALRGGTPDAVLFFSPRGARVFSERVGAAGLNDKCKSIIAICISRPAAAALAANVFRQIRIAARPDQQSMLALLGESLD